MSKKAIRIANIGNQLYLARIEQLRSAGFFDDLMKKYAPNLQKGIEKSSYESKAKNIGKVLEQSNLGEQLRLPIKKTTEITNMSPKGVSLALNEIVEYLENVISGQTSLKFKDRDPQLKTEFAEIKKIMDDIKEIQQYITKVKNEYYKLHGAIENTTQEQKESWSKQDSIENQRAIRKAEKEIQDHLSSIYINLFEKAFANTHRKTDMARTSSIALKLAYEEGISESLDGSDEDSAGTTEKIETEE